MQFEIRECDKNAWRFFSKYHYLSDKLPGGFIKIFGLFQGANQIGFVCFSEYVPWRDKTKKRIMHSNRLVIHPDYVGFGLGVKLLVLTSQFMHERNFRVMTKFSSLPVYKALKNNVNFVLVDCGIDTPPGGDNMLRNTGFRKKVKWWSFEFVPQKTGAEAPVSSVR